MRSRRYARAGEVAWCVFGLGALVYEYTFEDLLSMATERWCRAHPVAARLAILALAGHLACVLPSHVDVFNADNMAHRAVVAAYRLWRSSSEAMVGSEVMVGSGVRVTAERSSRLPRLRDDWLSDLRARLRSA